MVYILVIVGWTLLLIGFYCIVNATFAWLFKDPKGKDRSSSEEEFKDDGGFNV